MSTPIRLVCAILLSSVTLCSSARAASTVIDTNGFKDFNIGDLAGQPTDGGAGSWFEASNFVIGAESTARVQNSIYLTNPSDGADVNAVKVERKSGDDAYWGVPVSSVPFPNNDLVIIEWDMLVEYANVTDGFGPFFGVSAFDGGSSPKLLGSVGVDANTGEILYQAAGTGVLTPIDLGLEVDNEWHQYRMAIDYTNGAYQVMYDGQLVLTEFLVDPTATAFTDADITAIASGGEPSSLGAVGTSYFDNFVVVNFDRLPGDYDVDGDVDGNDYAVWRANYGSSSVPGLGADGNGDGVVDAADYTVWRDNFPSSVQGPTAGSSAAPEPAGVALLSLGLATLVLRRRG